MIFELLYTSVPKGLKSGSKGYCTVLVTEGIPSALQERLESFSGYRHLSDSDSSRNPVTYAHRIVTVAGNRWHILSRVADYGSDYSQRSNLIAHHVAISSDEIARFRCGPTALMLSAGLFRTEWKEEPRRVGESETRARLSSPAGQPRVSRTWASVTGDAGWGGRLTQLTEESSSPISIVYPAGTEVIKLLDESASLLPPERQWDVTFNTFFIKSAEECTWRCFHADIPESKAVAGTEFLLQRIRSEGRKPAESAYVEAARTGKTVGKAGLGDSNTTGPKKMGSTEERAEQATNTLRRNKVEKAEAQAEQKDTEDFFTKSGLKPAQKLAAVTPPMKGLSTFRSASTVPPPVNANQVGFEFVDAPNHVNESMHTVPKPVNNYSLGLILGGGMVGFLICVVLVGSFLIYQNLRVKEPAMNASVEVAVNDTQIEAKVGKKDNEVEKRDIKDDTDKNDNSLKSLPGNKPPVSAQQNLPSPSTANQQDTNSPLANNTPPANNTSNAPPEPVDPPEVTKKYTLIAISGQKNHFILPVNQYLQELLANPVEFEKALKEGLKIEFPSLTIAENQEIVYPLAGQESKLKVKDIKPGSFVISLPQKDLAWYKENIDPLCFAFMPFKDSKVIQLFIPVSLNARKVQLKNATDVSSWDYFVNNKSRLYEQIVKTSDADSHLSPKVVYRTSANQFLMVTKDTDGTTKAAYDLNPKEKKRFVLLAIPKLNKVLGSFNSDPNSNIPLISIKEYTLLCPFLFTETAVKLRELQQLKLKMFNTTRAEELNGEAQKTKGKLDQLHATLKNHYEEYMGKDQKLQVNILKPYFFETARIEKFKPSILVKKCDLLAKEFQPMSKNSQDQTLHKELIDYLGLSGVDASQKAKELFSIYYSDLILIRDFIDKSAPKFEVYFDLRIEDKRSYELLMYSFNPKNDPL